MTERACLKAARERATGGRSPAVFLAAGEASGDWAGARLADSLRRKRPDLRLRGIGGRRMAAAGVELVTDSSDWGAIGLVEALGKVPRAYRGLRRARRDLATDPADALVLIDSGGINIPFARMVRRYTPRMLYYLPPGSWSRKRKRRAIQDLVEVIATPFSWSKDVLSGGRARVEWVGHPVLEAVRPQLSSEDARRRYGLDAAGPIVALAPGSREQEMRFLLPVLAEAAALLADRFPGLQLLVPVSDAVFEGRIREAFERRKLEVVLLQGMEYEALQLAQAAAVCSGTATLEFACLRVPMAIVYKASLPTTFQYVILRGLLGRQRYAGMPNIIAQREIVPELLRRKATPEAVARVLTSFLMEGGRRDRVRADLEEVVRALGREGASDRTAELVLGLLACEPHLAQAAASGT